MTVTRSSPALGAVVEADMAGAESAVRTALAAEGFGILTEIDVAATLRAKLGVERSPLKILGACNPRLAHQALTLDPSLALVLPCNVVIEDVGDGRVRIAIADPGAMLAGDDTGAELAALADTATTALAHAMVRIRAQATGED